LTRCHVVAAFISIVKRVSYISLNPSSVEF
jgi:hypothetical protein